MLIIGHDPERTFVHLSRQGNGYQATVVPPA